MSALTVHRAARATAGPPTADTVRVERPPTLPEASSGLGGLLMLLPMVGAGASMTVMMLFRGSSLAAVGALMMVVTVLASVAMVFSQRGKAARSRRTQREVYLAYLERLRAHLTEVEVDRLARMQQAQPHPRALLSVVVHRQRLWERRRCDTDFLCVRIGIGPVRMHDFERQGDPPGVREVDTFMQAELERVERRFGHLGDGPLAVDLKGAGHVSVLGDRSFCDRIARIVLAQATTFASPTDLHIALAVAPERAAAWDGALWLPHLLDQHRPHSAAHGPERRLAANATELARALGPEIQRRMDRAAQQRGAPTHPRAGPVASLVVLLDEHGTRCSEMLPPSAQVGPAALGMTVVHLVERSSDEPGDVAVRIRQQGGHTGTAVLEIYARRDEAPQTITVSLDDWDRAEFAALSRTLSGLRLSPDSLAQADERAEWDVGRMLGLEDPATLDLDHAWAPRPPTSFLRVPIGVDDSGEPVMLDLKESAQSGMGPHGLCVGATGSGKSELLRTLVLALLSTHSPHDVAMVLVDYKGGATFAPFRSAPHVHGVITNLNDDATLVERVYASLAGEVRRRQQMLKDAGDLTDITAYRKQRAHRAHSGEEVPPMPHLLVIIDEFGELLTARPDFIELFLSIGRIGRSIGVHLLLSSQRIESGKLRGLDTYLSYRLGLRTLSEAESRTVLDTPDAFALPAVPGFGYLKVDTATYTRFRAGYVSGPLPPPHEQLLSSTPCVEPLSHYPRQIQPAGRKAPGSPQESEPAGPDGPDRPTVLSETVARVATVGPIGPGVWSDPLPDRISLDRIRPVGVVDTAVGTRIPNTARLRVPVGVMDDPARQWQGPWEVDLGESSSHVLIVGGPRSGRSTLLRTIAASLSLTHSASDVVIYGVDALGSQLHALAGLPTVAGIAGRTEAEVTRRIIEEVHATLLEREEMFTRLRVDSLARARTAHDLKASGQPRARLADIVLLIDGYGPLGEEHEAAQAVLQALIRRGPTYGIRVVATVSRWSEVRLNQQTFFGTTIEMRLGDPAESGVDRTRAATLTHAVPGRCLLPSGLFAQVALPRIDGGTLESQNAASLAHLVQRLSATSAERARPVRVLPASLSASEVHPVPASSSRPGLVPLGLDEATFSTSMLDLDGVDRFVLVVGDSGTGRTGLLRHLASSLVESSTPDDLVVAVIDPRHTLRDQIPADFVGGYAGSCAMASRLVAAILPELDERAARLADAAGSFTPPTPRITLLVDDYDVLTASGSSPLAPLVPYISMGRELNLNVVLARRTSGASRGIFEPTFAALRDAGATGLLLSGDRGEGQLFGSVRPVAMPTGRGQLVRAGQGPRTVQTVHSTVPTSLTS
ncbi:MAG: type VII secretion protein EccCa [Ornithinimicrobium sp.]